MQNKILLFIAVVLSMTAFSAKTQTPAGSAWTLTGNAGTSATKNFLGTTDDKNLIFRTNNIERMRVGHAGNIGISVANPSAKLQIDSGTALTLGSFGYLVLGNTSLYNLALDNTQIQARLNGKSTSLYLNYLGGTTFIGSGTKSTTGLVANGESYGLSGYSSNSGSVGVNGAGPSDGFGVAGSGYYGMYGYSSNDGYGVYGHGASTSAFGVEGYSVYSVGVYGATGSTSAYAGFFVGSVYTTGTYNTSDENLKQNITDFSSAVNILSQLHPKQYQFRQDGNYKLMNLPLGEHYGLMAQDVEKVLPGLVKNSSFDVNKATAQNNTLDKTQQSNASSNKTNAPIDFKAVNYTELIPVLVKAIQEQQQQIQIQDERINNLEQTIQKLTSGTSINSGIISGCSLQQNSPNPFTQNTTIRCNIPSSVQYAQLIVYSNDGKPVKTFSLNSNGNNEVNISAGSLTAGEYIYTLIADGKMIDSKHMILTK